MVFSVLRETKRLSREDTDTDNAREWAAWIAHCWREEAQINCIEFVDPEESPYVTCRCGTRLGFFLAFKRSTGELVN
jgi:hypothetical protein